MKYKFPARGEMPPVDLTWYDGNMTPREVAGHRVPGSGVMFVGSEGELFATYTNYRLFPAEKFAGFEPPEKTIPDSICASMVSGFTTLPQSMAQTTLWTCTSPLVFTETSATCAT